MSKQHLKEMKELHKIPKIIKCEDNVEYHLMHTLGSGCGGTVFSTIECLKNGKKVRAVKVIAHNKIPKELIDNEVEKHQKCYFHPNIMKLNRVFSTNEYTFMVMPRMSGSLNTMGMMTEDQAKIFFRQMVDAVKHVHLQGVVHHDIKRENFMYDENQQISLSDFGLCELVNSEKRVFRVCGTPNTAAPEVLLDFFRYGRGEELVGHSFEVDIWGLGSCLYQMLTGNHPFLPSQKEEYATLSIEKRLYHSILEEDMRPANVSYHAKILLTAMLQKDPANRITIDEILNHPFLKK